eukprot:SAG31_NODE_460_length_15364_cov_11.851294_19_plen_73_part_00
MEDPIKIIQQQATLQGRLAAVAPTAVGAVMVGDTPAYAKRLILILTQSPADHISPPKGNVKIVPHALVWCCH